MAKISGPHFPPNLPLAETGVVGAAASPIGYGVAGFSSNSKNSGYLGGTGTVLGQDFGVLGIGDNPAVMGLTVTASGTGVYGGSDESVKSFSGIEVRGVTFGGAGVQGESTGPKGLAGKFVGNVEISGNLTVDGDVALAVGGADFAEDFDVVNSNVEPGTVVVATETGRLEDCTVP